MRNSKKKVDAMMIAAYAKSKGFKTNVLKKGNKYSVSIKRKSI